MKWAAVMNVEIAFVNIIALFATLKWRLVGLIEAQSSTKYLWVKGIDETTLTITFERTNCIRAVSIVRAEMRMQVTFIQVVTISALTITFITRKTLAKAKATFFPTFGIDITIVCEAVTLIDVLTKMSIATKTADAVALIRADSVATIGINVT